MNQNWRHVCHPILHPHIPSLLFLRLVISTSARARAIDTLAGRTCRRIFSASTGRRFNAGCHYATELYKQGHHLSVLRSSLSGIIECLLFKHFSPPSLCLLFYSLCAKSQHPLFRPKKRRLLPCSTCVPSSGDAEQLEEMWSGSPCRHTSDSLSLKAHPWLLCSEKQTMEQYSCSALSKQKGPISISFSLSPCSFSTCAFPAANGYPDVS